MPVTCAELRKFASEIATDTAEEAALRASVSRAYYALFHTVLPIAEVLPKSSREKRTDDVVGHEAVRERLFEWRADPKLDHLRYRAKMLSAEFEKCRKLRVIADYRLQSSIALAQAKRQCTVTQELMTRAQQLQAEMDRNEAA